MTSVKVINAMLNAMHPVATRGASSAMTHAVMLTRFSKSMKSNDEFGMSGRRIDFQI